MRTINKALAIACLGLLLLAGFPLCASAFDGIVTPKDAKRGVRTAGSAEQSESAEDSGNTDGIAAAHSGEENETSSAAQTGDGQSSASGSAARTAAGTAVLVGAGAYTFIRTKWKEQEDKSAKEPVYFVNHTKRETGEAQNYAMENAGKTTAGDSAKM